MEIKHFIVFTADCTPVLREVRRLGTALLALQTLSIDLLHEYDPLPQPLSQNGRGEPELALLPWWEKGWDEGLGLMQEV